MGGRERYKTVMEQLAKPNVPIPADDADALFAEYADMVYRLAFLRTKSGTDADDIVQDVFLRALRAKPAWNSREHQKAWFLKVTINCSKSLLTSAWRRNTVLEDENLLTQMQTDTEVYPYVLALPPEVPHGDPSVLLRGVSRIRDRKDHGRGRKHGEIPSLPRTRYAAGTVERGVSGCLKSSISVTTKS